MKYSHLRTPRTRRDAFGEDTRLGSEAENTLMSWAAALCIGALIGLMFGLGIR